MTGSGNDFVMVDARGATPDAWTAADIRAVCARGTGIGADGVVFLGPGTGPASVKMTYFNSDGSHAALCGNAALCTTWLAARLGIAPAAGMRLETDAGVYQTRCAGGEYRATLGLGPVAPPAEVPGLELVPGERALFVLVGVPHLVVLVDDVDQVDVSGRGRALRGDPALGPEGANVNFVSPGGQAAEWRMRTYERGVEGETLACGTGAVGAACALEHWGLAQAPVTLVTHSGGTLDVQARRLPGGQYGEVSLTGEARLVFRGVLA